MCTGRVTPDILVYSQLRDGQQEDRDVEDDVQGRADICLRGHVDAFALLPGIPS